MKKITLLISIMLVVFSSGYGQISSYSFSQTAGTYTPITGGTTVASITTITGTSPTSAERMDDIIYNLPNGTIPFSFVFDGVSYTGLNISSNGFITFGATSPSTTSYTPISSTTAYAGAISAFGRDLEGGYHITADRTSGSLDLLNASSIGPISIGDFVYGTGIPAGVTVVAINGSTITLSAAATSTGTAGAVRFGAPWSNIQYATEGVAPNRVFVIQFSNFKRFGTTTTTSKDMILNFQFRLNETTNTINIVYGNCSPGVGTTYTTVSEVGLRGATNAFATNVNNRRNTKGTNDDWVNSVAGTANTSGMLFNTTAPANVISNGLTYTWSTPSVCSGTPVAGSVTPVSQNICAGVTPANLVATGYSTGVTGITFQWEESNDNGVGDAWAPVVGGTGATTATYTPASFAGATIYYRLNVTCTGSGLSAQTASVVVSPPANPTTQITAVTIPSATVGYSQAVVNWTNGNGTRRAVYISDSATFTDPVNGNAPALTANAVYAGTGQQLIYDGTAATVTVTGLSGGTQYYIKAYEYTRCGSGPYDYYFNVTTGTNTGSFITCGTVSVPSLENFSTYVPGCWQEADNGDTIAGPATFGSSSWIEDGFGNVGTTGAARYNIFTTGANDWLMSPVYNIPATGYELKFDAAATQYAATTAPTTPWESDDYVEVLVSTGTSNWTLLYTYNDTNVPSSTGSTNIIDLDAYAGQSVRFAFRAVEGASNGSADIDFSVDNFEIRLSPACSNPVSLVVNGLTSNSANITWGATTGNYEYVLDNVATDPVGSGTPLSGETYNATLLSPSTTYYFHVRTVCSGPLYSVWSTISFTTPATPPANDDCVNAIALTAGGVFGDNDIVGTTVAANTVTGLTYGCQTNRANDVWYSVVVPASGTITIETQADGASLLTDTVLSVFSGTCGALTEVGCSDDEGTGNFSILNLTGQTPGATLYIGVWRWSSATNGTFLVSAYDSSLNVGSFDTSSFKVYPNPVKDVLNLVNSTEISSVEVYNLLGQKVLVKELNTVQGQIDMSNLNAGNYFVKILAQGQTKTLKIVKE